MGFHFPDPGRIIHDIQHGVQDVANQARHGVEDAANQARHGLNDAANQAQRGVNDLAHKLEGEIKQVAHDAEGQLNNALHSAQEEVTKVKRAALDEIAEVKKLGKKAIDSVEGAIVAAAFKKAIGRAVALARIGIHKVSFSVQAIVGLEFAFDTSSILEKLQEYLEKPPSNSDEVKQFLIVVAPSEVSLFVGGGLSLGVELDCELRVSFEKENLIENWDSIIEALT